MSLRAMVASIRVGWYREFNWTNPLTGFSLRTVGPLASVIAASTVYYVGSTNNVPPSFDPSRLAYILIGAALYAHVAAYSWVPTLAIAEGKWTYVFPQVYISPHSSLPYLTGRTLASFVTSTMTVIVSLVLSFYVLSSVFHTNIPFMVNPLSVSLLFLAMLVNIFAALGLGLLLSAYALFATKFEWALPTYVAGLLMVFSEALFPVSFLPWPLSAIANVLPFTEFMRASRQAMIQGGTVYAYFSYLGLAVLGGIVILAMGFLAFRYAENRARRMGVIDKKTA
ncbi:MAG TPA: ABC transporter permease [Candidatus Bathyarchaeia archaeon]|nr:ABC transporter permease [Candidatus Bathyarchaeia archaeon]